MSGIPAVTHAVIAGFGLPGRFVAELFDFHGVSYTVIDANPRTAERCPTVPIIAGNVRDEEVLKRAGIEKADLLVLAVPDDSAVLQAIPIAQRLRPGIRIIARVNFTSTGLKLKQFDIEQIVVGEQLVAREMFAVVRQSLGE